MRTIRLYRRAEVSGCYLEDTCVDITPNRWDRLMTGATQADKKLVTKIALMAGVIDEDQARAELKNPWYNPYKHKKTSTHAICVHSGIEYFIKVN